ALSFEDLVQTLERERRLPRTALCQAMFILQHARLRPVALPSLTMSFIETEASLMEFGFAATTCNLVLVLRERPQGLVGACIYKASLFEATTIRRMLDDFRRVLENIVSTELGENVWRGAGTCPGSGSLL